LKKTVTDKQVNVALVGTGAAAKLHINAYKRIHSSNVVLHTICSRDRDRADNFAKANGISNACCDFNKLLQNDSIDVIDICTPPFLHKEMIIAAMQAGKHVICEKPLAGYFGKPGDPDKIGINVKKEKMFRQICLDIDELEKAIKNSKGKFMYAENFIYAPMLRRAGELIAKKKSKIIYSCGELYVRGSTSAVAGRWDTTGGGPLIRNGCHIISAVVALKKQEAEARGEKISIKSINCDTGLSLPKLSEYELRHISARPVDVEDFACLTITFSDDTKSVVLVTDAALGGNVNTIRIFANDCVLHCDLTPSSILNSYFVDNDGIEGVELSDRLPTNLGWERVDISDEILRGYVDQFQDFADCIVGDRLPRSSFDIAAETLKIIYASYWSAEIGQRIDF